MRYTKEEKLRVVKLFLDYGIIEYPEGITTKEKTNIRKKVRKWVGVYRAYGEEGLEQKCRSYSFEDKKYAVERVLNGESQYQVAFSLGVTNTKQIREWVQKYNELGWDGLKTKGDKLRFFELAKTKEQRFKELEKENSSLKKIIEEKNLEIEYLKKLEALVSVRLPHIEKNL